VLVLVLRAGDGTDGWEMGGTGIDIESAGAGG